MVLKEKKEMDDNFKKAQKPWVKILNKVEKAKLDYHNACKAERSASNQERNATGDNAVSPEQVSWFFLCRVVLFVTKVENESLSTSTITVVVVVVVDVVVVLVVPSSSSKLDERESCFPRVRSRKGSSYGRMYRIGYGNGDPIARGFPFLFLVFLFCFSHDVTDAGSQQTASDSFPISLLLPPMTSCCSCCCCLFIVDVVVAVMHFFSCSFLCMSSRVPTGCTFRSANYKSAFNEPKMRCSGPKRNTRPPCKRSIPTTRNTWRTCRKYLKSASKWRHNVSPSSKKSYSTFTKD